MAGDSKKLQPIIIKRVRKGGHNHHGGAWKIAYADFVTAMMAFFLLHVVARLDDRGRSGGHLGLLQSTAEGGVVGGSAAPATRRTSSGRRPGSVADDGQVKQGEEVVSS